MNDVENPTAFVPSASEYILDNFEQTVRIAMLVLNRDFGETLMVKKVVRGAELLKGHSHGSRFQACS